MKDDFKSFRRDDLPEPGVKVEVLCDDGKGLAVAPVLCCWTEEGWIVAGTRRKIRHEVVGWRLPEKRR